MTNDPLLTLELPGVKKLKSGKVREVFDLGARLLFVATDRISAFDCVMPNGIPRKGEVLTQISYFWFDQTEHLVPNHLASKAGDPLPASCKNFPRSGPPQHGGAKGPASGHRMRRARLPLRLRLEGLPEDRLGLRPQIAARPARFLPFARTALHSRHQGRNRPRRKHLLRQACEITGRDIAEKARDLSLKIYSFAAEYALQRGIIIADTKFEFGLIEGKLVLIDEVLTPDSSRFWPADQYEAGRGQPSFDKQYVRDYLETLSWNKQPPAPALPADVVARTTGKYLDAYRDLTSFRGPLDAVRRLTGGRYELMRNLVDDFLVYLRHERGQSEQTQKTYAALLLNFVAWAEARGLNDWARVKLPI
jgi:phosphoribosylaminoimidazole-succinocarboxamide synthase